MNNLPGAEKEWSAKRASNLADDLDVLLGDLCIIWGFCGGLTGWELTREGATVTAEAFAQAVLAAEEDMSRPTAKEWLPKIMGAFEKRYGASVSEHDFRGA